MDSTTSCKVIPCIGVPMAIDHFFSLISAYLQGWTSQSIAVWRELTGYQLVKASHCKYTNSPSEHEFVIYTLVDEHKNKLELRTDRAVVDHKECKDVSLPSLLSSEPSLTLSRPNETNTKVYTPLSEEQPLDLGHLRGENILLDSDHRFQISDFGLTRHSEAAVTQSGALRHDCAALKLFGNWDEEDISESGSEPYLATNMVLRIQGHPDHCQILNTITFSGDPSLRPSLWDVIILNYVVHNDSLLEPQCSSFAYIVFDFLKGWAAIHRNGIVDRKGIADFGLTRRSTGSLGAVTVNRHNVEHVEKIWRNFEEKKQAMNQQKEEYERARTEENETRLRLEKQVEVLMSERAKHKRHREDMERHIRKEQKERERRHQEEQRLLKQEFAKLQLELQQKDRELQMVKT